MQTRCISFIAIVSQGRSCSTRNAGPEGATQTLRNIDRGSQITSLYGPYHLINTALNVPASKTANRRGRNADFFIFSPKFVGSKSTNYVATEGIEDVADSISRPRWRHRAQWALRASNR